MAKLNIVIFSLLTIFIVPLACANKISHFNQSFSSSVARQFKELNIPGGAYAIIKDDEILALETFGYTDKTQTQKVTPETVFRLASVSKTFAATVTTMLAQEHKLDLSDPITKFVPKFTLASEQAANKIKIRHLLSHSSGLMPNAYDNLLHEDWSFEKIISRFDRITPLCQPDQCYGYQNIAYSLIQPAIEASQKKSFTNLVQDRLFSPLDMKNASVGIDVFLQENNIAKPHVLVQRVSTGKKNKLGKSIKRYIWRTVPVTPDFYKVAPAAGINASITDLAKWLIANMGYAPDVLSPSLLKEITTPRIQTKRDLRKRFWRNHLVDAHYGYGWRIYQFKDYPVIYHSGWVQGFRADIGYSPELGIGFAMLMNAESSLIGKISSEFWTYAKQL
ncbi:serine hydrolase domain-containing protein [Catenovulum adriaticum]|uniref:Beta-lactamase family protein n=1 Tax=Catenovulum adriaticum TaxID=2984846 RepID=A0ABY7ALE2_9ALTE|nr:serine hydrolase domain-containing protein [Catenovulum sp. TS8]WAJ69169.1 beta-lactamase family protein [Catenovulum sp. TS8]